MSWSDPVADPDRQADLQRRRGLGSRACGAWQREGGFGLVELLIAMIVMVVGIMAIVAGFSSGMVALGGRADTSTAGALADKQMEAYRALPTRAISTSTPATPPGEALRISPIPRAAVPQSTTTAPLLAVAPAPSHAAATPTRLKDAQQTLLGADNRSYNVDTYIVAATTPGAAKKVTLVVHNADSTKTFIRETSTFDPATGCTTTSLRPAADLRRTDMAAFAYDAINAQGLVLSGDIHAADVGAAREQLQSRGLLAQDAGRAARRRRGRRGGRRSRRSSRSRCRSSRASSRR